MNKNGKGSVITTVIMLLICIALAAAVIYKILDTREEVQIAPPSESNATVNVYVKEIKEEEFVRTVRLYGTVINNSDDISVVTLNSGYVTAINVKKGDEIKVGDVIGYVDPSTPGSSYKPSAITSKVEGTVTSVNVSLGQMASSGASFVTVSPKPEYVIAVDIPERYIESVSIGSKATVTSSIISDLNETALISYVDRRIDTSTRTYNVEFTCASSALLEEGLVVTVDLVTEGLDNALTVPLNAVSTLSGGRYVYKVVEGKARQTAVETGNSNREEYVVVNGLEVGDVVIVEGTVTDGVAVNILER